LKQVIRSIILVLALLCSCSSEDPMTKVNKLINEGRIAEAKKIFKNYSDTSSDPLIKQAYIQFLYERKQYHDFRREAVTHLQAYPEDKTVKDLEFNYYAKLATDAERQQQFEMALDYIVAKLLSPDFQDYRKWERQQTVILKDWFDWAAKQENPEQKKKEVLTKMKSLGFDNLGQSLAPEMWDQI